MSQVVDISDLARELLKHLEDKREAQWDGILLTLDKVSEIANCHSDLIAEVGNPVAIRANLRETYQRYAVLVNNVDLADCYGRIHRTLATIRGLPNFKSAVVRGRIDDLIEKLTLFQRAVFTLDWHSILVAEALENAARIACSKKHSVEPTRTAIRFFAGTLAGIFLEDIDPLSLDNLPPNKQELIKVIQLWGLAWQRHVQRALHGGGRSPGGLTFAIAQVKCTAPFDKRNSYSLDMIDYYLLANVKTIPKNKPL